MWLWLSRWGQKFFNGFLVPVCLVLMCNWYLHFMFCQRHNMSCTCSPGHFMLCTWGTCYAPYADMLCPMGWHVMPLDLTCYTPWPDMLCPWPNMLCPLTRHVMPLDATCNAPCANMLCPSTRHVIPLDRIGYALEPKSCAVEVPVRYIWVGRTFFVL